MSQDLLGVLVRDQSSHTSQDTPPGGLVRDRSSHMSQDALLGVLVKRPIIPYKPGHFLGVLVTDLSSHVSQDTLLGVLVRDQSSHMNQDTFPERSLALDAKPDYAKKKSLFPVSRGWLLATGCSSPWLHGPSSTYFFISRPPYCSWSRSAVVLSFSPD